MVRPRVLASQRDLQDPPLATRPQAVLPLFAKPRAIPHPHTGLLFGQIELVESNQHDLPLNRLGQKEKG